MHRQETPTDATALLSSFSTLIAEATNKALARELAYFNAENQVLRARLPERIQTTPAERAKLIKYGKCLGPAIRKLITIVEPDTFMRWVREAERREKAKTKTETHAEGAENAENAKRGRPKTEEEIRELVVRLRQETGWGYTRIVGELKKLGVRKISRQTVNNILVENGFEPDPDGKAETWDQFQKRHAESLWACDFFSKKIIGPKGFVWCFAIVFLHIASRKVFITRCTTNPDSAWVGHQAAAFAAHVQATGMKATHLILDRDSKYTTGFDSTLRSHGIEPNRLPVRSPNLNAHCERFQLLLKSECTDQFIVFGQAHFDYIVRQYVEHYHDQRCHQSLGSLPPTMTTAPAEPTTFEASDIIPRHRLGELLKHYERKQAA